MNDGSQQQPQPPLQPPQVPQPQENIFIATPPEPSKKNKGPLIVIIILVVLVLGGAGAAAYFLLQPKDTTQTSLTPTKTAPDRAAAIIERVRTAVKDQLVPTYPGLEMEDGTQAPVYQPSNTDYAVYGTDFGKSLAITDGSTSDAQLGQHDIETLVTVTLAEETDLKATTNDGGIVYQNEAVVCSVSTASNPTSVFCANTSAYDTLIKDTKVFADAYFANADNEQYKGTLAFSKPVITEKSNGFSNATVSITSSQGGVGGFSGLFYAKDKNWTFWKGTQAVLLCSDYTTSDLQRAFEGDRCDDAANKEATVKVAV
jgi:hypothetical protein